MAAFHSQGHSSNLDPLVFFCGGVINPAVEYQTQADALECKAGMESYFLAEDPY